MKIFQIISFFPVLFNCIVMSIVQLNKANHRDIFLQNLELFIILVCIDKPAKFAVELVIHYLFLDFIVFFLNFRKLEGRKLTCLNITLLTVVLILFLISLLESSFTFIIMFQYLNYPEWDSNFSYLYWQIVSFDVFNIKDTIITVLLCSMFYYKGMQ